MCVQAGYNYEKVFPEYSPVVQTAYETAGNPGRQSCAAL